MVASRDRTPRNRRGLGIWILEAGLVFGFVEVVEVSVGTEAVAVETGMAGLEVEELVEVLVGAAADKRAAVMDMK